MMPKAPIEVTSANGKKTAPQEGLARESSGMPVMISPLISINNSIMLPTPRQRIVHPIRSDSQYVGTILNNPFHLRPSQGPVKATDAMGWVLEQEAEEAESVRTVWESGRSALDSDPSADRRRAGEQGLQPLSVWVLHR